MRFPHLEIPPTYQDDPGIGSVCSFQSLSSKLSFNSFKLSFNSLTKLLKDSQTMIYCGNLYNLNILYRNIQAIYLSSIKEVSIYIKKSQYITMVPLM